MPCPQLPHEMSANRSNVPTNLLDQQSTSTSIKRPRRARQSCTRCRKQKLKCSGEVPCARCVSRGEQDSCELWHRGTGRPKSTNASDTLDACAYFSHVLQTISPKLVEQGQSAPDLLQQLARLWLMVAVYQKGADKELAEAEIARSTMILLTTPSTVNFPFFIYAARSPCTYCHTCLLVSD